MERYYDIQGFTIAVRSPGSFGSLMEREFGMLRCASTQTPSMVLQEVSDDVAMEAFPRGSIYGLKVRFGNPVEMLFNRSTEAGFVMLWLETLLTWEDKTLVHSGCVIKDDRAYLFCAGPNVGKTTTVIGLVDRGMKYVSDDWSLVGRGEVFGYPKTIHIYHYNLDNPRIAERLGHRVNRMKVLLSSRVQGFARRRVRNRYVRFAAERLLANPLLYVHPEEIGWGETFRGHAPIRAAVWLERADLRQPVSTPIPAEDLAERALRITLLERRVPFEWYYGHARDEKAIEFFRGLAGRQQNTLAECFGAVPDVLRVTLPFQYRPQEVVEYMDDFVNTHS